MQKEILIIRFSALGDLITFEPYFRAYREFFTDYKIVFLTKKIGYELYKDTQYFDEIILFDNLFSAIKKVRKRKFDMVVNLQCNRPSHVIALLANKKRVLNNGTNIYQRFLGIKKVKGKSFQDILIESGIKNKDLQKTLNDKNYHKISIKQNKHIEKNNKLIVISTGSSEKWTSKRWGVENYINLIRLLICNGFEIALIGSNLEKEDGQKIVENTHGNIQNFINKTTFSELFNILSKATLFIGNDSGPAHIAAAVGTNTITIFGSTDTKHCVKYMPYFGNHNCIKPKNVKCSPCYKSVCPKKDEEYMKCMKSISVEDIFHEVKKLMD